MPEDPASPTSRAVAYVPAGAARGLPLRGGAASRIPVAPSPGGISSSVYTSEASERDAGGDE